MVHIRLPPGFSPRSQYQRPAEVHTALYKKGNYMLVTTDSQDSDSLWCLSTDHFPFHNQLVESVTRLPLEGGPTWALAELKHEEDDMSVLKDPIISSAPMVVSQHLQTPRRWLILSAQGSHLVSLLRPVDLLRQLLIEHQGAGNEAVKCYFETQPEAQACATCLVLSCLESNSSPQITEWATQAFFLYGGFPSLISNIDNNPTNLQAEFLIGQNLVNQTRYGENSFAPHLASTPMQYQRYTNQPKQIVNSPNTRNNTFSHFGTQQQQFPTDNINNRGNMRYSNKHIGLNLYFSRILRPLWNRKCVRKSMNEAGKSVILSVLSKEDCDIILHHLYTLGQFLNRHMSMTGLKNDQFMINNGNNSNSMMINQRNLTSTNTNGENIDPYIQEKTQLEMLLKFLAHVCEVLNLWKILIEHRFYTIASEIPEDIRTLLLEFTFKDLFVLGHTICVAMIIALINSYLSNNADVENITTRLRKLCPTFYRSEDAACSKANEILLKIITDNKRPSRTIHSEDRSDMIQLALDLCKKVAPDLRLDLVGPQFAAAEAYEALVELCVNSARVYDKNDIAVAHYRMMNTGNTGVGTVVTQEDDRLGAQILDKRMKMYREIINTLEHLSQCGDSIPNANRHIEYIITLILQQHSSEELLHVTLYDWMLSRDALDGDVISRVTSLLSRPPPLTLSSPLSSSNHNPQYTSSATMNSNTTMINPQYTSSTVYTASATSLGVYLESLVGRRGASDVTACELLYRYREMSAQHAEAARLLYDMATSTNVTMSLSERIRYMSRAVMSLRNSKNQNQNQTGGLSNSQMGHQQGSQLFVRDIEDKLEIAAIQQRVLECVKERKATMNDAVYDEVVKTLNSRLYDVSQLYQEFAEPLCLHEAKLALLKCSDHNDARLIENVWTQIIDQHLDTSQQQNSQMTSQQTRIQHLLIKVKPLISQYKSTPYCLPLVFITRKLEILCCRTKSDCSLVSATLLQSGILFENVYETYQHILHSNDRCWSHEGDELYFVRACAEIVKRFLEQRNNIAYNSRIKLTNSLQDFISSCVSSASSISSSEESQKVVREFRSLQAQLVR